MNREILLVGLGGPTCIRASAEFDRRTADCNRRRVTEASLRR